MATIRDIVTRALRRGGILAQGETPDGDQGADALKSLNEMFDAWKVDGVDILKQADYELGDTFLFFVPPVDLDGSLAHSLIYQATWNASTNSPSLASSTGTEGYVYRVATAGSTTLDDVTSWAVNDYAVFDGNVWLKSRSADQHRNAVTALLAVRLCSDYGVAVPPLVAAEAMAGLSMILAQFNPPYEPTFDSALIMTSGRRTWL